MVRLPWILVPLICCTHISSKTIPSFRVVAPQTICEGSENESLSSQQQYVTITLFPRNRERLTYNFQIFFKNLGNYQSQRRTLELWQFIRSLEYRINVRDRLQLSETNLLTINRNELTPGIAYVFHVVATANNGITSKGHNFTIKYLKGDVMNSGDRTFNNVNLVLLAPENTLAGIPFVAVAKVEFCPQRFDYYFQWNIPGLSKQFQKDLQIPRSTLTIPGRALKAGQEYQVEVSVLQTNNSRKIAGTAFPFKVLTRGFELFIIPTSVNAGLKQPVAVEIVINDFDGYAFQMPEISWTADFKCNRCGKTNKTRIETSFDTVGNYTLTAKVKKGTIVKAVTSKITIAAILLYYEFSDIPNPSIPMTQDFNFDLVIKNLIPKCEGEWTSVEEEGFEFLPQLKDELKPFKVNSLEQNYLSELSDYGNSTKSKIYALTIPRSDWFKGNGKYKFRLQITCPNPFLQEQHRKTESWFEFDVITNAPPQGAPLEIRPTTGVALQTVFLFATNDAKHVESNSPFRYEFFYKIDNFTVSVGSYYEYRTAETVLPYSDSSIQTFYEVCDVRNACSIIDGPLVKVNFGEVTALEAQHKLQEIALAFQRQDFFQGQTLMLISALSYSKISNADLYGNFRRLSINILSNEINKQYERPRENSNVPNEELYKFVRLTKEIFEVLDVTNTDMIRKLLSLMESVTEETNPSRTFRKRRELKRFSDSNTSRKVMVDGDFAQLTLELMERLLKSIDESNKHAEKLNILENINKLIIKLCKSKKIFAENIRTNLASIDIWKRKGSEIVGTRFPVLHHVDSKSTFLTINLPELQTSNEFCLTLAQFPEDYYTAQTDSPMYNIQLFDNLSLYTGRQTSDAMEFLLPTTGMSQKCLMRGNENWSEEYCKSIRESDLIKCNCKILGYLRLSADLDRSAASVTQKIPTSASTRLTNTMINEENLSPYTTAAKINLSTSTSPKPFITSQSDNKTSSNPVTASIAAYVLPVVGLSLIVIVIGGTIAYSRRRRNDNLHITGIESIEPREQIPGLKYGRFHDEHLLIGIFE